MQERADGSPAKNLARDIWRRAGASCRGASARRGNAIRGSRDRLCDVRCARQPYRQRAGGAGADDGRPGRLCRQEQRPCDRTGDGRGQGRLRVRAGHLAARRAGDRRDSGRCRAGGGVRRADVRRSRDRTGGGGRAWLRDEWRRRHRRPARLCRVARCAARCGARDHGERGRRGAATLHVGHHRQAQGRDADACQRHPSARPHARRRSDVDERRTRQRDRDRDALWPYRRGWRGIGRGERGAGDDRPRRIRSRADARRDPAIPVEAHLHGARRAGHHAGPRTGRDVRFLLDRMLFLRGQPDPARSAQTRRRTHGLRFRADVRDDRDLGHDRRACHRPITSPIARTR